MSIEVNSLAVEAKGIAYQYDVLIQIQGRDKPIVFNKDTASPLDKLHNRAALSLVYEQSGGFGVPGLHYVFDGSSIMYTNVQFNGLDYELEPQLYTPMLKKAFRHRLMVVIKPTESHHVLDYTTSLDGMTVDDRGEFKRLTSLLVTQDAVNQGKYCVLDQSSLFVLDESKKVEARCGVEFRSGFKKGFRFAKTKGKLHAVVDIDVRTSAFYKAQSISAACRNIGDYTKSSALLGGVITHPEYNPHRRLFFAGFNDKNAVDQRFQLDDGKEISVYDYFVEKKNIKIQRDVLLSKVRPKKAGFFPSEKLIIAEFQRVNLERLDPSLVDELHKTNAVPPAQRYRAIVDVVKSLNLTNGIVKAFGFTFTSNMMTVKPLLTVKPRVQVGSAPVNPKDDGNFRDPRSRYVQAAAVNGWAVFYGASRNARVDPKIIEQFVKNICDKGRQKGMTISVPELIPIDMNEFSTVGFEKCSKFAQKGIRFVMVIDQKTGMDTHRVVKLMECRYRIVTQQLNYALVDKCVRMNQAMTLENILNKVNMKNGGVNYAPKFEQEAEALSLANGTLVVGYQARHSRFGSNSNADGRPVREPSAIGFAGNYGKHLDMFVGSYVYQHDPRYEVDYETVDPKALETHFKHMLTLRARNMPKYAKPAHIVILRDGVSEYQYGKLIQEELKMIKSAIASIDSAWKPKILFCVTTEEHAVRIFSNNRSVIDNPPPGTIIADGPVREGQEFFITAQKAIKGTAKPVKVAVLANETAVTFAGVQKFIHALCYTHQLTCSPTALPEPIYQSQILSQRAHVVLSSFKEFFAQHIPWNDDRTGYKLEFLNEKLAIVNTPLELVRYTA